MVNGGMNLDSVDGSRVNSEYRPLYKWILHCNRRGQCRHRKSRVLLNRPVGKRGIERKQKGLHGEGNPLGEGSVNSECKLSVNSEYRPLYKWILHCNRRGQCRHRKSRVLLNRPVGKRGIERKQKGPHGEGNPLYGRKCKTDRE